jgi:hypothetical protein
LDAVERYLLLGLRLGRHVEGLVDAYYGPPELASAVEAVPPAELAAEAAAIGEAVAFDDERRTMWLRAQLGGCEATARRLAGEQIGWAEEVERCYGVRPDPVPEERFAAAHERVDAALPGEGTLAERYRSWVESHVVPPEKLLDAAHAFERALRARTEALVGLPEGEAVDVEPVRDEPWSAFNYYLGGLRSRVVINTDQPVHAFFLPTLVAHEIYPGHHTEHAWKEALLVDGDGRLEETIFLVGTPQAVVSEGIASIAVEVAFGDEVDEAAARVYDGLGIDYDPGTAGAVRAFRDELAGLRVNAARLLHVDRRPESEVVEYVQRWGLNTRERAESSVRFLTHPTWRAYASCYSSGEELCRQFVGGDVERFRRLLTEQFTTSELIARS